MCSGTRTSWTTTCSTIVVAICAASCAAYCATNAAASRSARCAQSLQSSQLCRQLRIPNLQIGWRRHILSRNAGAAFWAGLLGPITATDFAATQKRHPCTTCGITVMSVVLSWGERERESTLERWMLANTFDKFGCRNKQGRHRKSLCTLTYTSVEPWS